jgi:hypothetical protein
MAEKFFIGNDPGNEGDLGTAANWTGGTLPVDADDIIFDADSPNVTDGFSDLSGITPASAEWRSGCSASGGASGTPVVLRAGTYIFDSALLGEWFVDTNDTTGPTIRGLRTGRQGVTISDGMGSAGGTLIGGIYTMAGTVNSLVIDGATVNIAASQTVVAAPKVRSGTLTTESTLPTGAEVWKGARLVTNGAAQATNVVLAGTWTHNSTGDASFNGLPGGSFNAEASLGYELGNSTIRPGFNASFGPLADLTSATITVIGNAAIPRLPDGVAVTFA